MLLLVLNLPLAPLWARVMLIPRSLLFGGILVLASVGAYSLNRSLLDLVLLYIVGAVGCAMRVYDIPLVPAVMGLVLGPLAEQQFRRTLAISQGDMSVFVTRPVCALLLLSSVAVLFGPRLLRSKVVGSISPNNEPRAERMTPAGMPRGTVRQGARPPEQWAGPGGWITWSRPADHQDDTQRRSRPSVSPSCSTTPGRAHLR